MNPSNGRLKTAAAPQPQARSRVPSIHWLFRSNIPRRRTSYIPPEVHKRDFFGMGELLGVISNVRSVLPLGLNILLNTVLIAGGNCPFPH